MTISQKAWRRYLDGLRKVNDAAAGQMADYLRTHSVETQEEIQAALDFAYALSTKYGEGATELACEMYDAMAEASGAMVPPAVPAETATYGEVAKAVRGAMKQSMNPDLIGSAVGRQVKTAGVDTTMKNALRDGAEWAWIPAGDTCAFCLTLASRGWQKASKKAIRNGHAEHIHANCDCTYAVRFDGKSTVAGYDPDALLEQYYAAGDTPQERINAMRRAQYANNGDIIREQKKAIYARNRRLKYGMAEDFSVDKKVIHARRVDKYGYNNIYVDDNETLSERQLRIIDKQISSAKEALGVIESCDVPIIVTDLSDGVLATYNPKTNVIQISKRMSSEEAIHLQKGYACPDDDRSTVVHELYHWSDAEEYRRTYGEIRDASGNSEYSVYEREKAYDCLLEQGVDIENLQSLMDISSYAYESALDNNWEEVYTEYRTAKLLKELRVK